MKHAALALLAVLSLNAQADGLIRPTLGYTIDKTASGGSTTTTTRQLIDLPGGYVTQDGWMILGAYSMESKTTASASSSTTTSRTSYGAGGGWMSKQPMGPYVDAIYYINSTMTNPGNKYEGDGWQVDVGYKFNVSNNFGLGLQLAYRNFTYKKLNGAALAQPYQQTNLDPMFALLIMF